MEKEIGKGNRKGKGKKEIRDGKRTKENFSIGELARVMVVLIERGRW